jgi:hypothetical protein
MSAVATYREKIRLNGYQKRHDAELKVATGELPVLPRSQLGEERWQPFGQMLETAAGVLPNDIIGRGYVLAKMMQAKKYTIGMFKNLAIAKAHALQAVEALVDLGVPRDKAVSMVADIVGLSKSLLTGGRGRGGGAAAGGGAPGA